MNEGQLELVLPSPPCYVLSSPESIHDDHSFIYTFSYMSGYTSPGRAVDRHCQTSTEQSSKVRSRCSNSSSSSTAAFSSLPPLRQEMRRSSWSTKYVITLHRRRGILVSSVLSFGSAGDLVRMS